VGFQSLVSALPVSDLARLTPDSKTTAEAARQACLPVSMKPNGPKFHFLLLVAYVRRDLI